MATRWGIAFSAATWLTLVVNAALRRRARSASSSGERESGARVGIRSVGGVALAAAVVIGSFASPSFPAWVVVTGATAAGLTLFGLVYAARELPPWVRLVVVTTSAAAAVTAGVRAEPTGIAGADIALTIAWIVVVTIAVRRADYTDGLAASLTAFAGAGLFGVAAFGAGDVTATVAVALVGGCVGFLTYNARPASTFLGEGGGLFLGFALAILTVEITPAVAGGASLLVPALLVALPALDLALLAVPRFLWSGRLGGSRRDRLTHRLVAQGLPRPWALRLLVLAEAVLAVLAVLVGRGVVSVAWGSLLGGAIVGMFGVVGATADVPHGSGVGLRRRVAVLIALAVVLVVPMAVAGGLAWDAQRLVEDGRASVQAALAAARRGDARLAEVEFSEAAEQFDRAEDRLSGPLTWLARGIPVLGPNLRAARELAGVGADLAGAGQRLAASTDPDRLRVTGGVVNLDEVRRVTPELERGAAALSDALDRIDELHDPYLAGPVDDAIRRIDTELTAAEREARNGVAAARLAPAIFGADEPRRYFLAAQNPAELRATGGLIGNWGILTVDDGSVELGDFQRIGVLNEALPASQSSRTLAAPDDFLRRYSRFEPAQNWQNVNMSPDFPTVGAVIADLLPQSGGAAVDGVVAVDPVGLSALLELTGPVMVENWPVPITADNVVDVTLRQAYDVYGGGGERVEFLGAVTEEIWDTATEIDLGSPAEIASALGRAGRDGHLIVWFTRPEEQALAEQLGIAGATPKVRSDSLLVTTQNAAANKVDFYLERDLDYSVHLEPDEALAAARVTGRLEVHLDNPAPPGIASYALGPNDPRFAPGENRSFVSVYTPLPFTKADVDGVERLMEVETELGRNVYSSFVSVPAGTSATLGLDLDGSVRLEDDGWYRLDLVRQPALQGDRVTIEITVPEGLRIADAVGLDRDGDRRATGRMTVEESTQVRVRLEPDRSRPSLWDRLIDGPEDTP